jgi:fructose-1-phosphate kinase PfkB-like protein
MIVTVTLNPALDVILKVNNLKINQYNKVLDTCINLWWQRHKCIQSG